MKEPGQYVEKQCPRSTWFPLIASVGHMQNNTQLYRTLTLKIKTFITSLSFGMMERLVLRQYIPQLFIR